MRLRRNAATAVFVVALSSSSHAGNLHIIHGKTEGSVLRVERRGNVGVSLQCDSDLPLSPSRPSREDVERLAARMNQYRNTEIRCEGRPSYGQPGVSFIWERGVSPIQGSRVEKIIRYGFRPDGKLRESQPEEIIWDIYELPSEAYSGGILVSDPNGDLLKAQHDVAPQKDWSFEAKPDGNGLRFIYAQTGQMPITAWHLFPPTATVKTAMRLKTLQNETYLWVTWHSYRDSAGTRCQQRGTLIDLSRGLDAITSTQSSCDSAPQ